jgi:hypothetical protein
MVGKDAPSVFHCGKKSTLLKPVLPPAGFVDSTRLSTPPRGRHTVLMADADMSSDGVELLSVRQNVLVDAPRLKEVFLNMAGNTGRNMFRYTTFANGPQWAFDPELFVDDDYT